MKKLKMFLAGLLAVSLLVACSDDEKKEKKPVTPPEPVEAVTFTPAGGEVESGATVTLATATDGASIYYVFGGKAVDLTESYATDGTLYTAPVAITEAGVLSAVAVKDKTVSTLTTADYTIAAPETVEDVTFSPAAGELEAWDKITLATATEGADIYYEVVADGATATISKETATSATKYAEPLDPVAGTIYAIAVKGEKTSEITNITYTVAPAEDIPADSIRKWTAESTATDYKVYTVKDLKFLAKIVNEKNALAGVTITLANDITVNAKVLKDDFTEPDEGADATPNADLVNLDSIGYGNGDSPVPFSGTFDGNYHTISGLYIYQAHQGLGFFGNVAGATIKNLALRDACIINSNASGDADGHDDDRFGGLVGDVTGDNTVITNVVFEGVVGSAAAVARGGSIEYAAGLIGRADKTVTVSKSVVLARVYGTSGIGLINEKGKEKVTADATVAAFDAATQLTEGQAAIAEKLENFAKPDITIAVPVIAPASGEVEVGTPITITCETEGAFIAYSFGTEVTPENYVLYEETKPAVSAAGTIYAVGVIEWAEGKFIYSDVASATYTLQGDTAAPTATPDGSAKILSGDTVTLTTETADASIYYVFLTEGDAPAADAIAVDENLYTAPIAITANGTLYAVAKKGNKVSLVTTVAYTLKVAPGTPVAATAEDEVEKGTKLKFTAEPGTVYYEFVAEGGTSTITAENYATVGRTGSFIIADNGSFVCIAENDGLVSAPVTFAYTAKDPQYVTDGLAAINEKLANVTHAEVTATADIKDGLIDAQGTEGEEGYVAAVKDYIITDAAGLAKLSEIVNGGNALAGYTFTVANDITINAKVLRGGVIEPDEGPDCTPNANLVNLDSIGWGDKDAPVPFSGTFNGNNYTISGFYAYQGHHGLGFFGLIKGATIQNVIIRDACVINKNAGGSVDGTDDDRFGGFVGFALGDNTITNCIFEGVVGSAAALGRGTPYEYIGGLVGRNDGNAIVATDIIVVARVYGSADVVIKKGNIADKTTISSFGVVIK